MTNDVGAEPVGAAIVGAVPAAPVTTGSVTEFEVLTVELPLLVVDGAGEAGAVVEVDGVEPALGVADVDPPLVVQPANSRAEPVTAVSTRVRRVKFIKNTSQILAKRSRKGIKGLEFERGKRGKR